MIRTTTRARAETPQYKDTCAYCGKPAKLTKEHIWGKWSAKHLDPPTRGGVHLVRLNTPEVKKGAQHGRGPTRSRTLRIACDDCNGGWMKDVNERAKPTLVRLAKGEWWYLSPYERQNLAAWATLFTMSYEHSDIATMAALPSERLKFSINHHPPAHWAIGIARYEGNNYYEDSIQHTAFIAGGSMNTQTTTILFGKLVLHTYSSRAAIFPKWWNPFRIEKIWPLGHFSILPPEAVDDAGFIALAHFTEVWLTGQLPPNDLLV
jgi:hypothetical protein